MHTNACTHTAREALTKIRETASHAGQALEFGAVGKDVTETPVIHSPIQRNRQRLQSRAAGRDRLHRTGTQLRHV